MKLREGMIYEIIGDSFLLGFESAYRAAKKREIGLSTENILTCATSHKKGKLL